MDETEETASPGDALILDFDGSVSLPGRAAKIDLREYEERLRYAARFRSMAELDGAIKTAVAKSRIFFLGSGDFHHISYLLIKHMSRKLQVVVFDNHPDNMFFPAGIHCGSWVYHASRLPHVSSVAVFGIASKDLSGVNLVQNRFSAVRSGKVKYYCMAPVSGPARFLGGDSIEEIRPAKGRMAEVLEGHIRKGGGPVYLSVDKDVLSSGVVKSTWDQGRMEEGELLECIRAAAPYVVAADITGDISSYDYRGLLKRLLRRIDGDGRMPDNPAKELLKHREINLKILSLLSGRPGCSAGAELSA